MIPCNLFSTHSPPTRSIDSYVLANPGVHRTLTTSVKNTIVYIFVLVVALLMHVALFIHLSFGTETETIGSPTTPRTQKNEKIFMVITFFNFNLLGVFPTQHVFRRVSSLKDPMDYFQAQIFQTASSTVLGMSQCPLAELSSLRSSALLWS